MTTTVNFKFSLGEEVICPDGRKGTVTGIAVFQATVDHNSYSVRPHNFKGTSYRYWAEEDLKEI